MSTGAGQRVGPVGLNELLRGLLAGAFVVGLPLATICNSVRFVTLSPATYREGFQRYAASARTGLDAPQLDRITAAFIDYFQGPPGRLNPTVVLRGQSQPLFNEREVAHMEDVQKLMQAVFTAGLLAAAYLVLFAAVLVAKERGAALPSLGRLLLWGAGLTVALLVAVAGLSLLDFTELFIRFHQMSFQNDLWMLDPRTDYLLMLFPEEFWFDVTVKIAGLTGACAAIAGAVGWLLARR